MGTHFVAILVFSATITYLSPAETLAKKLRNGPSETLIS